MPIHDWTRVDAGIFHDFHHSWITELARLLNDRLMLYGHYALIEPDGPPGSRSTYDEESSLIAPMVTQAGETDREFYRRKQNCVVVRRATGDRILAVLEIVSPSNKSDRLALRSFVDYAAELLKKHIHLLVVDLYPTGPHDSQGIHGAIWEELAAEFYSAPSDHPLTVATYEAGPPLIAYVQHPAIGAAIPDMPLFLEPGNQVVVPLEATYQAAYAAVPRRWRRVLEGGSG